MTSYYIIFMSRSHLLTLENVRMKENGDVFGAKCLNNARFQQPQCWDFTFELFNSAAALDETVLLCLLKTRADQETCLSVKALQRKGKRDVCITANFSQFYF